MGQDDVRVTVRPLGLDEFEAWRALRLRALRDHPDAFGASFEDEAANGSAARRERFEAAARGEGSAIFGAFDGDTMVGIGGVIRSGGRKDAHRATMWGMYVAPEARGRGAGHGLVVTEGGQEAVSLRITGAKVGETEALALDGGRAAADAAEIGRAHV